MGMQVAIPRAVQLVLDDVGGSEGGADLGGDPGGPLRPGGRGIQDGVVGILMSPEL